MVALLRPSHPSHPLRLRLDHLQLVNLPAMFYHFGPPFAEAPIQDIVHVEMHLINHIEHTNGIRTSPLFVPRRGRDIKCTGLYVC